MKNNATALNDAQRQLVTDNMKLVYSVISKYYPTFISDDEVVDSGMYGLCKAALKWDETRCKFSTYAFFTIRNEIRQELRTRQMHQDCVSLNQQITDDLTVEDTVSGDEDVYVVDHAFLQRLNEDEQFIFELMNRGYEVSDIQKLTGYNVQKIRKIQRTIRLKYKKLT